MKKYKYNRKRGESIVKTKKLEFEGTLYKSPLEVYMSKLLLEEDIYFQYEPLKFILQDSVAFNKDSYERQSNGRGEFKNRGNSILRPITYVPDFVGGNFIIETKGYANESFPDKWKKFKSLLVKNDDDLLLFKPQNKKECEETLSIILSKEEWRDVEGYKDLYKVSSYGRVKGHSGAVLRDTPGSTNYPQVTLCNNKKRKTIYVHILVAKAFLPNPKNLDTVNHIDEIKLNNNKNNLEWLSKQDNIKYSKNKKVVRLDLCGNIIQSYDSIKETSLYGYSPSAVSNCISGLSETSGGYKWKLL